jgi:antitoxin (DNA-binding transcriptional repressor) of toxin-antitoxin stability system
MKSVGIREFRDKASHYLASDEAIAVKRHGKLVGFYIPVRESDEGEVQAALMRLSRTVESALTQSGWDEEKLSLALDLSQPE